LNGVDPKTGEKMTEESVIDNLITFLIAGEYVVCPSAYIQTHQNLQVMKPRLVCYLLPSTIY
jgi:hypothetical protein